MAMTTANWITVILALVGIIANLGWFVLTRFMRQQDELKHALTSDQGAIARIHQRIDKLGETYQTREATEMQFEHLREFMDHWRNDSERRHQENLKRFEDLKDIQRASGDTVREDVRALRARVEQIQREHA